MPDSLVLTTTARVIPASTYNQRIFMVASGATVYYSTQTSNPSIGNNEGTVTAGAQIAFSVQTWFASNSTSRCFVFDDETKVGRASGLGTTGLATTIPGSAPPSGAAGGDLTGTYPSPQVGAGKVLAANIGDPQLSALASTGSAADRAPYYTGSGTAATTPLTAFGRTLIDDADAATARATLGITTAAGPFIDVVQNYGATGDGSTDDTAAVQAAITYAKSHGGTVYFPVGVYKITSSLLCGVPTQSRPYRIQGASMGNVTASNQGACLHFAAGAGAGPMLDCQSCHQVEICNLHLQYATGYDGDLVDIRGCDADGTSPFSDCIDVHVHHVTSSAVGATTARSIVRWWRAIDSSMDHFHLSDAVNCVRFEPDHYCVSITVEHGNFNGSTDAHILQGSPDSENVILRDLTFEAGTSTTGIRGGTTGAGEAANNLCYGLKIENCWFGDSGAATDWIKNLICGRTCIISGCRMASPGAAGHHLAGLGQTFGKWLFFGNHMEGGYIFDNVPSACVVAFGNLFTSGTGIASGTSDPTFVGLGNDGWGVDGLQDNRSVMVGGSSSSPIDVTGGKLGATGSGNGVLLGASSTVATLDSGGLQAGVYKGAGDLVLQAPNNGGRSVHLIGGGSTTPAVSAKQDKVAFFNVAPVVKQTLPAAATDAATTQTLANACRTLLINYGLAS